MERSRGARWGRSCLVYTPYPWAWCRGAVSDTCTCQVVGPPYASSPPHSSQPLPFAHSLLSPVLVLPGLQCMWPSSSARYPFSSDLEQRGEGLGKGSGSSLWFFRMEEEREKRPSGDPSSRQSLTENGLSPGKDSHLIGTSVLSYPERISVSFPGDLHFFLIDT